VGARDGHLQGMTSALCMSGHAEPLCCRHPECSCPFTATPQRAGALCWGHRGRPGGLRVRDLAWGAPGPALHLVPACGLPSDGLVDLRKRRSCLPAACLHVLAAAECDRAHILPLGVLLGPAPSFAQLAGHFTVHHAGCSVRK